MIRRQGSKRKAYVAHDRTAPEKPWFRPNEVPEDLPRPLVVVNGAFDILHAGHMKILHAARQRGKTVIVAMDSDQRVARKGEGRPIQTFVERTTALNYMPVDYIVEIESDHDMATLFKRCKPNLRVQGSDYKGVPSKFPWVQKCFVRDGGMHTSKIIERCKRVPDGK